MFKSSSFLLSFLLLIACFNAYSQDDSIQESPQTNAPLKRQFYLISPRGSCTVQLPTSNRSFKKAFVGIYQLNAALHIYFHQGAFVAPTYEYNLLRITENHISGYNASMVIHNAGLKIGGDFFINEKNNLLVTPALTFGSSWAKFLDLKYPATSKPPENTNFTTLYIQPEVNIYYLIESNLGVGLNLSYTIYNQSFDPYSLRLNEYASFPTNNSGNIQYLSLGFSFYYSFFSKK